MSKLDKRIEELLGEMRKANTILDGSADDGGRKAAAMDAQADIAKKLSDTDEGREVAATADARKSSLEAQVEALTKLMREGKFPGFKVLGSWRVKRSTMQSVIDGTWEFEQPTEEPND